MALTTRRWFALLAVCCALLAALKLPPSGNAVRDWPRFPSNVPEQVVAAGYRSRIMDLVERVTILARRDSLLAATRIHQGTAPVVVATTPLSSVEQAEFERRVAEQASAIGSGARMLVLGIVRDSSGVTPRRVNYSTERQFLLPSETDGEHCLTIVKLGVGRRQLEPNAAAGLFGPCAFYAAFGEPGPAIRTWLRQRRYDIARDGMIATTAQPDPHLLTVRRLTREEELKRYVDLSYGFRPVLLTGCSGGNLEVCAKVLSAPTRTREDIFDVPITRRPAPYWSDEYALGEHSTGLLSDLLAEQGRARFEKFWKSSSDVETAFQAAFGEPIGRWTRRWVQYHYGPDTRGPLIASKAALLSLITSLGMIGASAAIAYRREVV